MDDARVGRHHLEIIERALTPPEERVPLAVARKLQFRVQRECVGTAEVVHLHRVVDDEFHWLQRIHAVRVAAKRNDRVAHRSQIHHTRDAREILQQNTRRHERNLR